MKRTLKIKRTNLPVNAPVLLTAVTFLLMDRLRAPGWVYGVAGTVLVILWISFFVSFFTEKEVDVLASGD